MTLIDFEISTDPSRLDIDMIHDFLTNAYWAKGIPRDLVAKSITNSNPFGVYRGQNQVGFARVISDLSTFAYLADLFILEKHQGRGLGRLLVEKILADSRFASVRSWRLVTEDAHDLYKNCGFVPLAEPRIHMEIRNASPYDLN